MTVGEIVAWLNTLGNKEQSGEYSPDQINTAFTVVNIELIKTKIGLPEAYQVGSPKAPQSYQITQQISDEVRPFIVTQNLTKSGTGFNIPTDLYAFSSLQYDYTVLGDDGLSRLEIQPIEFVTDGERLYRLNNYIKKPSYEYPIAAYLNNQYRVYPDGITYMTITYVRKPVTPVYGYTLNGDFIIYDPATSVQLEWPEILHPDFAVRCAKYLGVTIREEELYNMMQQRLAQGS
jgi:hypothetical protein